MDRIVICKKCEGTGRLQRDVGTHKSEYTYAKCDICKGSGRIEETTTTKHVPFKPGENKSTRIF